MRFISDRTAKSMFRKDTEMVDQIGCVSDLAVFDFLVRTSVSGCLRKEMKGRWELRMEL